MEDLTVGDFNNDGWMDIAYLVSGAAWIAENNHDSSFSTRRIGGSGATIEAADIDNDTRLDLLLSGEQLEIYFANGTTQTIDVAGTMQIVDADLDGDVDLAMSGTNFAIWHQDGTPAENEFQKIILEAILEGGQRNNALAVGGFVRSFLQAERTKSISSQVHSLTLAWVVTPLMQFELFGRTVFRKKSSNPYLIKFLQKCRY